MIKTIIIYLSMQMLYGYNADGQQIFQAPVAIGQPGYDTPIAETHITFVTTHPWWYPTYGGRKPVPPRDPGNEMGVAKFGLHGLGNIRIHGTDKFPDTLNGPRVMSSGCIRVLQRDMMALTELVVGPVNWEHENLSHSTGTRVAVSIRP